MSETNGNGKGRILSLTDKHRPLGKSSDFITVGQCAALIAEETTKVHEYYLQQIPPYVARMIQDALLSFGLIKMDPAVEAGLVAEAIADAPSAANVPTDSEGPEAA